MISVSTSDIPVKLKPPIFSFCFLVSNLTLCIKAFTNVFILTLSQITDILKTPIDDFSMFCNSMMDPKNVRGGTNYNDIVANCQSDILSEFTEKVIIEEKTLPFEMIFSKVTYLVPNSTVYNISEKRVQTAQFSKSKVHEPFLLNSKKCFMVDVLKSERAEDEEELHYDRYELQVQNLMGPFLEVMFYDRIKDIFLYIHPREARPYDENENVILSEQGTYVIGYSKKKTIHCVSIFDRRCHNYTKVNEEKEIRQSSRQEAIFDCKKKLIDLVDTTSKQLGFRALAHDYCTTKNNTLPDCCMIEYIPRFLQNQPNSQRAKKVSFMLEMRDHMTTFGKKTDANDFLVYIFSIFSLWFGFNFLGMIRIIKTGIIKRLVKKDCETALVAAQQQQQIAQREQMAHQDLRLRFEFQTEYI